MRTKLGISIMTILIGTMTTVGFGQENSIDSPNNQSNEPNKMISPEERANRKMEKMIIHLGLTADQTQKVTPIILEHEQKMQVLMDEQKSLKQRIRAERESLKASMDKILTEEQKVKRNELIEQRKQEHQNESGSGCTCCHKH